MSFHPLTHLEFSKPDAARDPTGHKVWLSAEIMPHILAARRYSSAFSAMPLPRIVELGSGTGLCGIAAASLGFSTTLTDGEPEVVSLLKRNVALNRFEDSTFVEHLLWDASSALASRGTFDLVISCDCVYYVEVLPKLCSAAMAAGRPSCHTFFTFKCDESPAAEQQRCDDAVVKAAEAAGYAHSGTYDIGPHTPLPFASKDALTKAGDMGMRMFIFCDGNSAEAGNFKRLLLDKY